MSDLLLRGRAMAKLHAGKLRRLRFRHAQIDSQLAGGIVFGHDQPQRGFAVDDGHGLVAQSKLAANDGLHNEIANMNSSKSHDHSILLGSNEWKLSTSS